MVSSLWESVVLDRVLLVMAARRMRLALLMLVDASAAAAVHSHIGVKYSLRGAAILLVVQIKFDIALAETVEETWLFRLRPSNENLALRVVGCLFCDDIEVSEVHFG